VRCSAPCTGLISLEDYGDLVDEASAFLKGKSRAVIARLSGLHRQAIWRCVTVGERAGVVRRVGGAGNPAVFEPGPNADILMSGWPDRRMAPSRFSGRGPPRSRESRVHAVNFRVQLINRPEAPAPDLPWRSIGRWGNCRQSQCSVSVDQVGTVRLRLIGNRTMAIYTPSFRADLKAMDKMLDVLYLRVQAVLSHLTRRYGYRFGPVKLLQSPEFAFPVDSDGVKRMLARWKPKTAKWWADASPESGGAEIETRDYAEAVRYLRQPERLDRLEKAVARLSNEQRTETGVVDRLIRATETLTRTVAEQNETTAIQVSRLTYLVKELAERLNRRQDGPKET